MKRALVYASVASMIQQFNMNNIRLLLKKGYQVDVACNMEQGSTISQSKIEEMKNELEGMGVTVYHISIPRSIFKIVDIIKSLIKTKKIINKNKYDLIHCHSPIGGMICRCAYFGSKIYKKSKLIYTAHGFHFYKNAPLVNWMLFYPIEKICSYVTDVLITINLEDYEFAQRKMKAKEVQYVPGVGIDTKRNELRVCDRDAKRLELGIPRDATVLISVGELNQNKNHEIVIRALNEIKDKSLYYVIVGKGSRRQYLEELTEELELKEHVKMIGYRSDVMELYMSSDICIFPSYREGLSVALMEAMSCGLPCIASRIRGNVDLIDENGGKLFDPQDVLSCAKCITNISDLREKGNYNMHKVRSFDLEAVMMKMQSIY